MALLPPPASLSSLTPPSLALKSTTNFAFPKRRRSLCTASWQEVCSDPHSLSLPIVIFTPSTADVIVPLKLVGVVVFSAVLFTAVKAIANSAIGESLQRRLEERKKVAVENSDRFRTLAQSARNQR